MSAEFILQLVKGMRQHDHMDPRFAQLLRGEWQEGSTKIGALLQGCLRRLYRTYRLSEEKTLELMRFFIAVGTTFSLDRQIECLTLEVLCSAGSVADMLADQGVPGCCWRSCMDHNSGLCSLCAC